MASKLDEIEDMRRNEPIHQILESEKKDNKNVVSFSKLIRKPKEFFFMAFGLNESIDKIKDYYENWDIVELFNYYTIYRAYHYEKPDNRD